MGHKVTMVCGVFDIGGIKPLPWYKLFKKEFMDGFDVIVCNVWYSNRQGAIRRAWAFIWFAFLATLAALSVKKPDLIFATHTPLTVGIPGYVVSRIKRLPFIFEVRDLWPEGFIIAGLASGDELYIKLIGVLESFLYKRATKILLVSKGYEDRLVKRGYPREKLKTILLGADGNIFRDIKPNEDFRKTHNLEHKTVAVYTGVHGWANGLDYVIDAANCLKDRDDIVFMFVGNGMEKPRLQKRAEEMGLTNVLFVDYVPKTKLPGILAVCDIGLMILRNAGSRLVTPNKIFDYMFAGLPSIVNFLGPTAEILKADQTGVFAAPGKPEELAEKVVYWTEHKDEAKAIGARAREIAFARYDRYRIAEQLAETFNQVCEEYKSGKSVG
jgi:glycosyltransferase involved in cell wall biosynthesis